MNWKIEFSEEAKNDLKNFRRAAQVRLGKFLKNILNLYTPLEIGKPISGEPNDYWSYRVDNYRVICRLRDKILEIETIRFNNRSEIYKMLNKIMKMKNK